MKQTELASALGLTPAAVSKLKKQGMPVDSVEAARLWRERTLDLSRTKTGRIDRPALFEASANGSTPAAADSGVGEVATLATSPAAPVQTPEDTPEPGDTSEYRQARAAREKTRAEREELELSELRGRLLDVEEASRLAFTAFRALRDALQNVPARLKDQLAAETDAFRVEQLLEVEITAVLASFDVESAVRDKDKADDDED